MTAVVPLHIVSSGNRVDRGPARELVVEPPGSQQRLIGAEHGGCRAIEQAQLPRGNLAVSRQSLEGGWPASRQILRHAAHPIPTPA